MSTQNTIKELKKELKKKSRLLKPMVWIGKNGFNEEVFKEIVIQLKKKELVKIKLVKSFIEGKDKREVAEDIALKTGAQIVDLMGFMLTIYRKSPKKIVK